MNGITEQISIKTNFDILTDFNGENLLHLTKNAGTVQRKNKQCKDWIHGSHLILKAALINSAWLRVPLIPLLHLMNKK